MKLRPVAVLLLMFAGCAGDPPGDGSLKLDLAVLATRAHFERLDFRVESVTLFYGSPPAPPAGDGDCGTIGGVPVGGDPLDVQASLAETGPQFLGAFFAHPGVVSEIRLVLRGVTAQVDGHTRRAHLATRCAGADNDGLLRLTPLPGESLVVSASKTNDVEVQFDPNRDIVIDGLGGAYGQKAPDDQLPQSCDPGPCGKPFKVASDYGFKVIAVSVPAIIDGRVVVRFKNGVPLSTINALISARASGVLGSDPSTNYYILSLPPSVSVRDALEFYDDQSEVAFTLPDTPVLSRQVTPCNTQFQSPGPFTQVAAPNAWAVTTGNRQRALLADIDIGFDMTSPAMVPNYFINQNELQGVSFFDRNADGTATAAEVVAFDTDGDGLITFVDLNAAAMRCFCTAGFPKPATCGTLTCDRDGDGTITPADLVAGGGAATAAGTVCTTGQPFGTLGTGFENGADDDCNGFIDDLVGWNFANNNNNPASVAATSSCGNTHGVGTSGIIAAVGAPTPMPPAMCTAPGPVAGMNWVGNLIPIRNGNVGSDNSTGDSTRAQDYLAIRYAVSLGADAINASWGLTFDKGNPQGPATSGCANRSIANLGSKYDQLLPRLASEAASLGLGNTLLVVAAEDCAQNDDLPNTFDWPVELASPNVLAVTSVTSANVLAARRAFGPASIAIAAPGENHTTLALGNSFTTGCNGTSFSAPLVTGAIGLLLANNAMPLPIRGNAATVKSRILCNATCVAGLASTIGACTTGGGAAGGLVLNVNASVTNANACP